MEITEYAKNSMRKIVSLLHRIEIEQWHCIFYEYSWHVHWLSIKIYQWNRSTDKESLKIRFYLWNNYLWIPSWECLEITIAYLEEILKDWFDIKRWTVKWNEDCNNEYYILWNEKWQILY